MNHKIRYAIRLLWACLLHWKTLVKSGFLRNAFVLRRNQLLLFNTQRKVLVRCSLSDDGNKEIRNNFNFLTQHTSSCFPQPRGTVRGGRRIVCNETLLVGQRPAIEIVTEELTQLVISLLNQAVYKGREVQTHLDAKIEMDVYEERASALPDDVRRELAEVRRVLESSASTTTGDVVKTMIHGDMTYRNLVVSDTAISFCDFSRSGLSFPEFDVFLFVLDAQTYRHPPTTFALFLDNILGFVNGGATMREVDFLYRINPAFRVNHKVEYPLKVLFLYRTLVHSLEYLKDRPKEMHEIINQVKFGFRSV